ncbi:hypothetical protein [Gilliamella sp. Pas-s95]|uniref:hypothetical protein n=1 Tax=Gilliamella sp. Pas-s95 TaxID=2687317 RepID=UPI001328215D|nr:hypothetical protein [Gilliamella sp. Pas-s95]MWN05035.1 hypothetical protein [Gilliamella sp. Pas-s95]
MAISYQHAFSLMSYQLTHHQIIDHLLNNFNVDFLVDNNIYFGGGNGIEQLASFKTDSGKILRDTMGKMVSIATENVKNIKEPKGKLVSKISQVVTFI